MMRRAVSADVPAIVALFGRHHAEQRFEFPFDPAQVSFDLSAAIVSRDWLCLFEPSDCALIAHVYRPPFLTVKVATEIMLRCERPKVGPEMRAALEQWAREQGCWSAALGTTHSARAFGRLYSRAGYLPAEWTFAKVL